MICVNRLRSTAPGFDFLRKHPRAHHHRMQESPRAQQPVRIGCVRTQQHRRRIDRTARQHIVFCYYFCSYLRRYNGGWSTIWHHRSAVKRRHLAVGQFEPFHTHLGQQLGAPVQRSRDGGHQHGLLRIGRATQAAGAQIPAALDVAGNRRRVDTQSGRAPAQQVIVLVRRGEPRQDVQALLGLGKIRG